MNAKINPAVLASAMAPQEFSIHVMAEKYAKGDETTVDDIRVRVANGISEVESDATLRLFWQERFLWAQQNGFVPAGRINSAAGLKSKATLINCFVQPVGDSITGTAKNGKPSIYRALEQAAETMRCGGGVGYNFSEIRPVDSVVKGTGSRASGPISFMKVFNSSCSTVESAGGRRGAQMAVLNCDHPDILSFITAKREGDLTNFNLSVGVSDSFMEAVRNNQEIELIHAATPSDTDLKNGAYQRDDGIWVHRKMQAVDIWELIMKSTYDFAEPGVLYLDRMNEENNLYYCENIEATNPCAEQPLPDYGCCDLGSINLTACVKNAFSDNSFFDYDLFKELIAIAIPFLDNVLDASVWPLEEQRLEAMSKRRIGLGFLGLGSALVMLGVRYDSNQGRAIASEISKVMRNEAYCASIEIAKVKGAFPKFDADKYLAGAFASRLPADIREDIKLYGIRNSHLLSIAPTGTITLVFADNASNGIEPAFSWVYDRKKRMLDSSTAIFEVADHAWRLYREMGNDVSDDSKLPEYFVSAMQMSANEHMKMLEAVQPFIDTSISKTVNVPADYDFNDFTNLYMDGWSAGLKGLATYRPNNTLGSVLSVKAPETAVVPVVPEMAVITDEDPLRKQFESRPVGDLQSVTSKMEYHTYGEGRKTVYLTVSFINVDGVIGGQRVTVERPFEFFMPAGQKSADQQWITSSMRLLSMAARSGGSIAKALGDLREVVWDKGTVRCGFLVKADGSKVPLFHDSEVAAIAYALQRILIIRGLLDADANQIPAKVLAEKSKNLSLDLVEDSQSTSETKTQTYRAVGKKCPECGAHELIKADGCERCTNCNYLGSCG